VVIGDLNEGVITDTASKISASGFQNSAAKWVEPGSVLVAMYGSIGKAAIAGTRLTTNQAIAFTDPRPIPSKYLFWFLKHRQSQIYSLGKGATQKNISQTVLNEVPFPIAPLGEQMRIVEKLEELLSDLEAGLVALERARANLKRYRAAVLKAAVEGRLTAKWRAAHPNVEPAEKLLERILVERRKKWEEAQLKKFAEKGQTPPKGWKDKYVEPTKPDVAALPALPVGWCWTMLEMLAEIVGGITKGQKREKGEVLREVPYLRVANVQRGFLDLEEMKTIAATEKEIAELRLERGDVLFNEGGDRDKLGRGWVWEGAVDECIHQNHVFRARLLSKSIQPKFVSVHGNTFGKHWFQRTGKQSVNLASINMTILRAFPVPVAPGSEQRTVVEEIEAQLSVCDAVEKQLDAEAVRATRLRQSILKRAFEGRLVPQDPKDEPASQLLARIRAGREVYKGLIGQRNGRSKIRQKSRINME
jgi:type I restriction enzyme S subunit